MSRSARSPSRRPSLLQAFRTAPANIWPTSSCWRSLGAAQSILRRARLFRTSVFFAPAVRHRSSPAWQDDMRQSIRLRLRRLLPLWRIQARDLPSSDSVPSVRFQCFKFDRRVAAPRKVLSRSEPCGGPARGVHVSQAFKRSFCGSHNAAFPWMAALNFSPKISISTSTPSLARSCRTRPSAID